MNDLYDTIENKCLFLNLLVFMMIKIVMNISKLALMVLLSPITLILKLWDFDKMFDEND